MNDLILTEDEKRLILEYRRKREQREIPLKLLAVAYEFGKWMKETGARATYSTFCDDFGFEGIEGMGRSTVYEAVMILTKTAQRLSNEE